MIRLCKTFLPWSPLILSFAVGSGFFAVGCGTTEITGHDVFAERFVSARVYYCEETPDSGFCETTDQWLLDRLRENLAFTPFSLDPRRFARGGPIPQMNHRLMRIRTQSGRTVDISYGTIGWSYHHGWGGATPLWLLFV